MGKRIFGVFIILLGLLVFFSCSAFQNKPITPNKNFEAFPSARDFDPPGQLFRKDSDGVTWQVGTLEVPIKKGYEETYNITVKTSWNLKGLFETIGVPAEKIPTEVKSELSRVFNVELGSVSGLREYIDDASIQNALAEFFKTTPYKTDNEYYLIRETISTKELNFKSQKDWLANFDAKSEIENVIAVNSETDFISGKSIFLNKKFDKYMRVWFKAEKLIPKKVLGIGPSTANRFELKMIQAGELKLR